MRRVGDIGELALIRSLTRGLPSRRDVVAGVGDDCAVVRPGGRFDLLLTTDAVIEGVHYAAGCRGARVGNKAAGPALSDIAAMGGEPLYLLFDLVAPASCPVSFLRDLYRGARACAARHGAAIVGGDTARGPAFQVHVFGVGRVAHGRAVLRSGGRPGDVLFVSGPLGGSIAGRHLDFTPRVEMGRWLAAGRWATAMIDVTDGLATDLGHLVRASGVRAVVDEAAIPLGPHARGPASAWSDGEDFELLFAVPRRRVSAFRRAWQRRFGGRAAEIGELAAGRAAIFVREPDGRLRRLARRGFEHFRS